MLHEVLHNLVVGNLPISSAQLKSLQKYKTSLRKIHSSCNKQKCLAKKRQIFIRNTNCSSNNNDNNGKGKSTALLTALQCAFDTILNSKSSILPRQQQQQQPKKNTRKGITTSESSALSESSDSYIGSSGSEDYKTALRRKQRYE